MLPVKEVTTQRQYLTLEDLQARRDELSDEIAQQDKQFTAMWNSLFVKREETTRTEFLASMVTHGFTAFDLFLMARKLYKTYRGVFQWSKKKR